MVKIQVFMMETYNLQSVGPGDISKSGYTIAKWGNIAMTRLFATSRPNLEDDGVKSYALAPYFTRTQLAM